MNSFSGQSLEFPRGLLMKMNGQIGLGTSLLFGSSIGSGNWMPSPLSFLVLGVIHSTSESGSIASESTGVCTGYNDGFGAGIISWIVLVSKRKLSELVDCELNWMCPAVEFSKMIEGSVLGAKSLHSAFRTLLKPKAELIPCDQNKTL